MQNDQQKEGARTYSSPKVVEYGHVADLTHGSLSTMDDGGGSKTLSQGKAGSKTSKESKTDGGTGGK